MAVLTGERSVDIDAPIHHVFAVAADLERAPGWQHSLDHVEVAERDAGGRPILIDAVNDARVRHLRARLRYTYDEPARIDWVQERGDVKSLRGWWTFEDLGDGRTRATYGLAVDPGRMLGLLLRGPVEHQVREHLLSDSSQGLKKQAEQTA